MVNDLNVKITEFLKLHAKIRDLERSNAELVKLLYKETLAKEELQEIIRGNNAVRFMAAKMKIPQKRVVELLLSKLPGVLD